VKIRKNIIDSQISTSAFKTTYQKSMTRGTFKPGYMDQVNLYTSQVPLYSPQTSRQSVI